MGISPSPCPLPLGEGNLASAERDRFMTIPINRARRAFYETEQGGSPPAKRVEVEAW